MKAAVAVRWVLIALYLASFAAVAALFARGASYYATPLRERAHHEG